MEYIYKALVTDKESGEKRFLESSYLRKEDFRKDLVRNGYIVHKVERKDLYDFMLENTNLYSWEWDVARELYWRNNLTKETFMDALQN